MFDDNSFSENSFERNSWWFSIVETFVSLGRSIAAKMPRRFMSLPIYRR